MVQRTRDVEEALPMAVRPEDVAPDAVFTQTLPAPPTPQPDGRDRSTWNGWPSRNTAEPRVIVDDQQRLTRIRTPVMELEGHMTPTHLFYVVQHFTVPEPTRVSAGSGCAGPISGTRHQDSMRSCHGPPTRSAGSNLRLRGITSCARILVPLSRLISRWSNSQLHGCWRMPSCTLCLLERVVITG